MRWFQEQGLGAPPVTMVRDVVVLGSVAEARRAVAVRAKVAEDQVPDSFSGTTDEDTFLVVSREAYAETFQRLYPEVPWTDGEYRRLLAHELAHRAHELVAISLTGSAEGMGPPWFFEGLALACAGQFAASAPGSLSWDEVSALIAKDEQHPLGYPRYADMFRSVVRIAPVKELVANAAKANFEELVRKPRQEAHP